LVAPEAEEPAKAPADRLVAYTSALRAWHTNALWTERTCVDVQVAKLGRDIIAAKLATSRANEGKLRTKLATTRANEGKLRTELDAVRCREQEHVDEVTSLNAEVASLRADLAAAKEKMETIARIASCAPLKRRRTASDTDIDTETE